MGPNTMIPELETIMVEFAVEVVAQQVYILHMYYWQVSLQ